MKRLKNITAEVNVDTVLNDLENTEYYIEDLENSLSSMHEFVGNSCDEFDKNDEYIDNCGCTANDLYTDIEETISEMQKMYTTLEKARKNIKVYKSYLTHKKRIDREKDL